MSYIKGRIARLLGIPLREELSGYKSDPPMYLAKTSDLESFLKERDQLRTRIEVLEAELSAMRKDHNYQGPTVVIRKRRLVPTEARALTGGGK